MQYDYTYKIGESIIHVVEPGNQSEEELKWILDEFCRSAREIIKDISAQSSSCTE